MKKTLIIIVCLLFTATNGIAQNNLSTRDSISTFYNKLVSTMKAEYLYKDRIDWPQTESELNKRLQNYTDFKSSLEEITFLFDILQSTHCSVYFEEDIYRPTLPVLTAADFSAQWMKKFKTNPDFEVKILDNQFGYILMPGMRNKKNIHKQAQLMYDEISKVKNSKKIKGWIIDLRFNLGGDIWPMLLALYDFLGDNDVWGTLDVNKKQIAKVNLKNGKYIDGSEKKSYIKPKGDLLDKTKVAVITSIVTGSSGEVTAIAFKGRENTIFIGEVTNGATTSNFRRNLPFDAYITLTAGYVCDRNEKFYEKLVPDIEVKRQDNFDDLLLDGNIQEAIKYIDGN